MDLKNKRICHIAQIFLFLSMLLLFTKIGGMGYVYVAASFELFYLVVWFFIGGLPDAIEYMYKVRQKKQQPQNSIKLLKMCVIYSFLACILIEISLFLINHLIVMPSGILYVDTLINLCMFSVPFICILQCLKAYVQANRGSHVVAYANFVFLLCTIAVSIVGNMILDDYGTKVSNLLHNVAVKHFYVILSFIPGIIIGSMAAGIFLGCLIYRHRDAYPSYKNGSHVITEHSSHMLIQIFLNQVSNVLKQCFCHLPVLGLLWFSFKDILNENYLFGYMYGGVLPVFGLIWAITDFTLLPYKKRLYISYKKMRDEQIYYMDLKTVLSYVLIHSAMLVALVLALHKSYLAIWNLQTSYMFMELMKYSVGIACLGLPCIILLDLLKYRNLNAEAVISVILGCVGGLISLAACTTANMEGIFMYSVVLTVQLLITTLFAAWQLGRMVGISYTSVLFKIFPAYISIVFIGIAMWGLQTLLFTAFGGGATLAITVVIGYLLLWFSILFCNIFDNEELLCLPFGMLLQKMVHFFK